MISTTPATQFHNADEWHKLNQGVMDLVKQEILPRYEKVSAERKADGSLLTEVDTKTQKATATSAIFKKWQTQIKQLNQ